MRRKLRLLENSLYFPHLWRLLVLATIFVVALAANFTVLQVGEAQALSRSQVRAGQTNISTSAFFAGTRPFRLLLPRSYNPATPAPLIIALHGFNQNGDDVEKLINLNHAANSHGFLYVHPDGTADTHGVRFWNATPECCDFQTPKVDDQRYLNELIDQIETRYSVDPKRIYLVGHSNGGFMANAMACNHSDRIAAIVDIAGGNYGKLSLCKPSQPINVLEVWGTKDVTYKGNHILGKPIAGALTSISYWAHLNGCKPTPIVKPRNLDIDSRIPGSETTTIDYSGCMNDVSVALWKINGADHQPHFSANFDELMIKFLLAHPQTSK